MDTPKSQRFFSFPAGDIDIFHARLLADQQVTYVLEFAVHLDLDRLNESLQTLTETLPILACTVQSNGSRFRWAQSPDYSPRIAAVTTSNDLPRDILYFVRTPCNPECETPLKIRLHRTHNQDILCFKVDHVLTDASGLKYLLYLFAQAYTTGKITNSINEDRGLGQIFRKFSPRTLAQSAIQADVPHPLASLISGPFDREPVFIEHSCFSPEEFTRIRDAAKQAGATLNDILLAALYRVIWQYLGDTPSFPVMVPVDMRRYLENQWSIGNLSSAVFPSIDRVAGESFEASLQRVKAHMDELKSNHPGLGPLVLMSLGALQGGKILRHRYQAASEGSKRFVNFTNFGVIDDTLCNFGGAIPVQAYGIGPNQYAPGMLIAPSTYQNTLHLVVQGNDTDRFQPFIHSFLDDMRKQLVM